MEDPDLLVPGGIEKFEFSWQTNKTNYEILGTSQDLSNISLKPGFYNIIVQVKDSAGVTAKDFIHIQVKEVKKPDDKKKDDGKPGDESAITIEIFAIIIAIIIVVLCLLFFILYKKKDKKSPPEQEPEQPDQEITQTKLQPQLLIPQQETKPPKPENEE